jgi:hypothetical protein
LTLLEPSVDSLPILQTLDTLHARGPPCTGWFVGHRRILASGGGEPEDRDALGCEDLLGLRPAALSGLAIVDTEADAAAAPSIEDDLGPGVGSEPGFEITIEPLLGGCDHDEVPARGVALNESPEQ